MTSPLGTALHDIARGADLGRLPGPEALRSAGDRRRRRTATRLAAVVALGCSVVVLVLASLGRSDPSTGPVAPAPTPGGTPKAEDSGAASQRNPIATGTHRFGAHAIAVIDGRFVVVGDSSDFEDPGSPVYWSDNGVDWFAPTTGNGPDSVNVTDVVAADGGLLAVGVGRGGPAAWRTVDGRTWVGSPVTTSAGGGSLWGVTVTHMGYYAWGFQKGAAQLWRSSDGTAWVPLADESVFDLPQTETICAVRDAGDGLRATGVVAPAGTREGHRVVWTSTDGETWALAQATGEPTFWCDPTEELGHWEARGDAGLVRLDPDGDDNLAELVPSTP
jgi:hypothetical protein